MEPRGGHGVIPAEVAETISEGLILHVWQGPAQTGGHRSNEVQAPGTLAGIVQIIHDRHADMPAAELAGTVLFRFCHGQPFGDCNKRTGLIIATRLMEAAGYERVRPDEEVWRYLNLHATNGPSRAEMVEWFAQSFRRRA
jgi:prophage maintenance system killer protein